MKKLTVLSLLFLLISCNNIETNNSDDIKEYVKSEVLEIEKKDMFFELDNNIIEFKKHDIKDFELKDLNDMISSIIYSNISEKAIENNNLKDCDKLGNNFIDMCKEGVIINNLWESIDDGVCNILSNTWSINSCKNSINMNLANIMFDVKFCEKIIENLGEGYDINYCKSKVLSEKAVKELNSNICNEILEESEINMCKDEVKMKKEMIEQEL